MIILAHRKILLLGVFSCLCLALRAQDGVDYTLVHPKKFENRTLASENSNNGKKIKKVRRFMGPPGCLRGEHSRASPNAVKPLVG